MSLLRVCLPLLKQLLLLAAGLMLLSSYSYADTDPRMVIEITADEEGHLPPVEEAIQQALPILWDRVVEGTTRASLSDRIEATPFLLRVVPHPDGIQVTFNRQRVWQYLDQHHIAYLREAPRLNLHIQMTNQNDISMPKTAAALLSYAESIALERGIVLDHNAPMLMASWRWLDTSQVYLSVQGHSVLAGFSETRNLESGDPLAQLQAWVSELLMKIRDAYIVNRSVMPDMSAKQQVRDGGIELILTIEQPAGLSSQVALEDALRQNSRVKAVIPTYLSAMSRQYRVLLKDKDDAWLEAWFRHRGMQITPTPYGWLVQ